MHDLRVARVRVQQHAGDVRLGVGGEHRLGPGGQVDPGPAARCRSPAALIISTDRPSPLNDTTSVDVASSAGIASRVRNSVRRAESRTSTSNDPSGSGSIAHRTTRSSSASQPA